MALKGASIDVKNIHTHTSGLLVATMMRLSFHSLILCIHFETGPITIYIFCTFIAFIFRSKKSDFRPIRLWAISK